MYNFSLVRGIILIISVHQLQKLADNGSNASENVANKEKKITFADEAGEKLCHVKFFENDMASFPGIDGDQGQEFLLK